MFDWNFSFCKKWYWFHSWKWTNGSLGNDGYGSYDQYECTKCGKTNHLTYL